MPSGSRLASPGGPRPYSRDGEPWKTLLPATKQNKKKQKQNYLPLFGVYVVFVLGSGFFAGSLSLTNKSDDRVRRLRKASSGAARDRQDARTAENDHHAALMSFRTEIDIPFRPPT